jgi:hypothetical protein
MESRSSVSTQVSTVCQHPAVNDDVWTWRNVEAVLRGAFEALLAAPLDTRDMPLSMRAAWPAVMCELHLDYPDEQPRRRPERPDSRQLALAMQAVVWVIWIEPPRDRRVLTGRLCGVKWRRLAVFDGRTSEYLRGELQQRRFGLLATQLNVMEKTSPRDFTYLARFRRFPN